MILRKGWRVHPGYGEYVDTSRRGTLLDTPGTMNAFVQWDGSPHYGLESLAGLRPASEPCTACGGTQRHSQGCSISAALAHTHPFKSASSWRVGTEPNCRFCGRPKGFALHEKEEQP